MAGWRIGTALFVLAVAATPVSAQSATGPRLEFAGRVGGIGTLFGGVPTYGGGATLRVSRRLAVEGDVALAPTLRVGDWSVTSGLYRANLRGRILGSRRGTEWFWTAGTTGAFASTRTPRDWLRLPGQQTTGASARYDRYIVPPVMPAVGTGVSIPFHPHAAVRTDGLVMLTPIGPSAQVSVGLSLALGRFGSR